MGKKLLFEEHQLPLFSEASLHPFSELDSARESAMNCERCALATTRTRVVFGAGNHDHPPVMFVGEGPGATEDAKGRPFVGRAGKLLDKMIESIGLQRKNVYVCNVVCCRPPNNRVPEPREIANCSRYLVRQIRSVHPRVIVALGATAAAVLTGKTQKVGSLRGKWFDWDNIPLRVTYHPAFLLRNSDHKIEAHADLKAISARVAELVKS